MRIAFIILVVARISSVSVADAQTIEITGLPSPGAVGQIVGNVTGVNHATHEVAAYLYVEGNGWWTKPTFGMPTVPINPDGSFSVNIGTGGLDEQASTYAVSVVPIATTPPQMSGSSTLDLGVSSITSTYQQRFGTNLAFAGHNWGVKEASDPVGPGGNRFSPDSDDVWVDQDGLHLTIQSDGGPWYSTEIVLTENLGYGTYMFQTSSRQDILSANATFGAFTWDTFGDDEQIPDWPFREIDFEDGRWGNPADPTNSQTVVQPYFVSGNLQRLTLPDLSVEASLTRFFTWSPGKIEFFTLQGHHTPTSFTPADIIHQYTYLDNGTNHLVPEPGRENFRFNLWLINGSTPVGNQPVEVVINDFQFFLYGDFDFDGVVDGNDFLKWQQGESPDPFSESDLAAWEQNYGAAAPLTAISTAVPEPATWIVLLIGMMAILFRRDTAT